MLINKHSSLKILEALIYAVIFFVSVYLRLWDLDVQAIHHDESLHAYYSYKNSLGDFYKHHPITHGVFLMHLTGGVFYLLGDSEFTSRLPQAIFGSALVLLPIVLRAWLGRFGSIFASVLLAFSPSLLYFSRFARNDIFMVFFALLALATTLQYIKNQRTIFLYLTLVILSIAFTTKETAYIVIASFGTPLLITNLPTVFTAIRYLKVRAKYLPSWYKLSPRRYLNTWRVFINGLPIHAQVLLFITFVLFPLFTPGISIFQNILGVVLAAPDDSNLAIGTGIPQEGAGMIIATILVSGSIFVSLLLTLASKKTEWIIGWILFYFVFILLFTNFFTYPAGAASGIWLSLGYWLAQHDVSRGGQPWWYFFMIAGVYEFLPLLLSAFTIVIYTYLETTKAIRTTGSTSDKSRYFIQKGDTFAKFCIFWVLSTFLAYTIAGEKFPWLMVNMVVPMIILSAKGMGDITKYLVSNIKLNYGDLHKLAPYITTTILIFSAILILLVFTVRASLLVSYKYRDYPQELMIYTQTSQQTHQLARSIDNLANANEKGYDIPIAIDHELSWPWIWYLRHYNAVSYNVNYKDYTDYELTRYDIHIVRFESKPYFNNSLKAEYSNPKMVIVRSSFDETKYRCGTGKPWSSERSGAWWCPRGTLSLSDIVQSLLEPTRLENVVDYWIYRRIDGQELSESTFLNFDSFVYFRNDITMDN